MRYRLFQGICLFCLLTLSFHCLAQSPANLIDIQPQPNQVVVRGVVPNEETRVRILQKVRTLYGAENVVDELGVDAVSAPVNWADHVTSAIDAQLRDIHHGQIEIKGEQVTVQGEVDSEYKRDEVLSKLKTALNSPDQIYTIAARLRVSTNEQEELDKALANRIVEFETGRATLTPIGATLLDEIAGIIPRLRSQRIQIIGHTDSDGSRPSNLALSQARADAVKKYLIAKGLPAARLETFGVGPDQPIASNDTPDGKARNRRIEFKTSN